MDFIPGGNSLCNKKKTARPDTILPLKYCFPLYADPPFSFFSAVPDFSYDFGATSSEKRRPLRPNMPFSFGTRTRVLRGSRPERVACISRPLRVYRELERARYLDVCVRVQLFWQLFFGHSSRSRFSPGTLQCLTIKYVYECGIFPLGAGSLFGGRVFRTKKHEPSA